MRKSASTAVAIVSVLSACASASGPVVPVDRSTNTAATFVTAEGTTIVVPLAKQASIKATVVNAPIAKSWTALIAVYSQLGIPLTGYDPDVHVLVTEHKQLRTVGDSKIGDFFRCAGQYESVVQSGQVYVTLKTQLLPSERGETTEARTEVSAEGYSPTGTKALHCESNGRLQSRIHQALEQAVAAPK